MHKIELLKKIRDAGWKILRQEGNHYVVERDGVKSGFAVLPSREIPKPTVDDIFKKLGVRKNEKMTKFYTKKSYAMQPVGTYGYELYNARAAKRMSAEDVGKAVGLSGAAIITYEQNKYMPKPETQEKLATVLVWPALHVIKSVTQTISDAGGPSIKETEPVVIETGNSENRENVELDRKRGWQARAARRAQRINRRKLATVPKVRRAIRKPIKESTTPAKSTIQVQFDEAMLQIRMVFNELVAKGEKWDAIKDLIKDEE